MPYTYDYTSAATSNESASARYWRAMKMALTRSVREKTFQFDGRTHEYLYHPYNRTWKNERGVEIPIFRELLLRHEGRRVLEVGNVLSHYFPVQHEVVDKYEVSPGVLNQDILEFVPQRPYDLIVSISTLEHVGWDEQPREPAKLLRVIEYLRSTCLAPSGQLVASLPIGYNQYFDDLLNSGRSPFTTQHFLKRVSKRNYWIESDWEQCRDVPYGRFVAHAIVIGTIKR
ncbi:MAG: class I SAM-dependent methyltransferase [Nitrospira sp.]|nr:class I SAM-dependent methyltransferase [Nitrospira sp.]MDH4303675.1 class I SAM-dependent methyltransferase [Nitrospira sp.]MDH5192312.1 class I SAM-dependent methyltransferase [Nitrospira sp.]